MPDQPGKKKDAKQVESEAAVPTTPASSQAPAPFRMPIGGGMTQLDPPGEPTGGLDAAGEWLRGALGPPVAGRGPASPHDPPTAPTTATPPAGTDAQYELAPLPMRRFLSPQLFQDLRGCLLYLAAGGLTFLGLVLVAWAFTGGRSEYNVTPSRPDLPALPAATASPAAAPVTRTTTATASFSKTSGRGASSFRDTYTVTETVSDGQSAYKFVQRSNNHEASGTLVGDLITATGSDGQVYELRRMQTPTELVFTGHVKGMAQGQPYAYNVTLRGPAPTAPAATASPTAAPSPTAAGTAAATNVTSGGDPNYSLAGAGLFLTLGGLGLGFGGRRHGPRLPIAFPGGVAQVKEEARPEACEEEKRQEAKARRRLDAARQRFEQLERLRAEHERAQAELLRSSRALDPILRDDPRAEIRQATLRAEREAVDRARTAYNDAGGGSAHASAQDELRQAESAWQAADAALKACLAQNPAPPPPPPPAPPAPPTPGSSGGATATGGTGAAVGTGADDGTRTRPPTPPPPAPPKPPGPQGGGGLDPESQQRVCAPGEPKQETERTSAHEYRIIDLRSATIVARHNALRTEEVPLGQPGDGAGPRGERGSDAFGEVYNYWSNASKIGLERASGAVRRDSRLQVQGDYKVRYIVHVYTLTCRQREECNAQGTGWIRRGAVSMAYAATEEGESEPRKVEVTNSDRNTVTREVLKKVNEIVDGLRAQNQQAENAATQFGQSCRGS